ncbi:MAG: alpha/beta hydrolase, partial [Arenicella sp.]|nr:alpha/beta hydrolase [Arenicella sp.]
ILLGHSMGGVVATILAERIPERVTCLVNIEGNMGSKDCFWSRKATQVPFSQFQSPQRLHRLLTLNTLCFAANSSSYLYQPRCHLLSIL